jgi:hypothetical protein
MTFDDDDLPGAEPPADLVPVTQRPPTTTGHPASFLALLERVVTLALDVLDAAGDAVAERLGIRHEGGSPPSSSPPPG